VLHPAAWRIDGPLIGAVALNTHFRRWLAPRR
jgi:hypothetical protein